MEGETEALQVFVDLVAQIVGDEAGDGLREIALSIGEKAAQSTGDNNGSGGQQ